MKCNKKTMFKTLEQAEKIIKKAWKDESTWKGKALPRRAYQCFTCGTWHLTSKPINVPAQRFGVVPSHHHGKA